MLWAVGCGGFGLLTTSQSDIDISSVLNFVGNFVGLGPESHAYSISTVTPAHYPV